MIRFKRRNTAWLVALAAITTVALVATGVNPVFQFVALAIFALAALASTVEIGKERESLMEALRRAPIRQRISPQAKEATERARSRGGFASLDVMMLDVGMIAVQSSYEGMAMRRTRSISKDDDGVRPFVTLNVDSSEADRNAVVRFEIYNQQGERQFVHEMRTFLREGEMNIMTDHHLPLAGNREIQGTGDWDLRVYLDGNLVAIHDFMLAPSMNERQRRLAQNAESEEVMEVYEIIDEVEQEVPPRLQDLLQGQAQEQRTRTSSSSSDSSEDIRSRATARRSSVAARRRR
ncbi:MAG: hypothetical protein KC496_17505 [Anaerolineae bacterium]|nr:hypothetical protein [Anaerolineae bacterium]